jgi:hypothetical protein
MMVRSSPISEPLSLEHREPEVEEHQDRENQEDSFGSRHTRSSAHTRASIAAKKPTIAINTRKSAMALILAAKI